MTGQDVGDATGLRADVGEGEARAIAVLIFPKDRDAAGIVAERVEPLRRN